MLHDGAIMARICRPILDGRDPDLNYCDISPGCGGRRRRRAREGDVANRAL
jgi:hypothetical protein